MKQTRKQRLRIEAGTVLAIPLNDEGDSWAVGQVIRPGKVFYMGVSRDVLKEPLIAQTVPSSEMIIYAATTDGELYRDRWRNLGVAPLEGEFHFPDHKVCRGDQMIVSSFDGAFIRRFDEERDSELRNQWSWSSSLLEAATRAACGFGKWLPAYEKALAPGVVVL